MHSVHQREGTVIDKLTKSEKREKHWLKYADELKKDKCNQKKKDKDRKWKVKHATSECSLQNKTGINWIKTQNHDTPQELNIHISESPKPAKPAVNLW